MQSTHSPVEGLERPLSCSICVVVATPQRDKPSCRDLPAIPRHGALHAPWVRPPCSQLALTNSYFGVLVQLQDTVRDSLLTLHGPRAPHSTPMLSRAQAADAAISSSLTESFQPTRADLVRSSSLTQQSGGLSRHSSPLSPLRQHQCMG